MAQFDDGPMDFPTFVMSLLSDDWLFFQEGEIAWDGHHHQLTGIQVNAAQVAQLMPWVNAHMGGFDDIPDVINYFGLFLTEAEKDEGLRVPRGRIAPGVRCAIREGDLTPITLANLAACGRAIVVRMVGDDAYAVLCDSRLAMGIPRFFDLVARLLWDLRQGSRSEMGKPFDVTFVPMHDIDADQFLGTVKKPVADAQDNPGRMRVTKAPRIDLDKGSTTASKVSPARSSKTTRPKKPQSTVAAPKPFESGLDHPTELQASEEQFEQSLLWLARDFPMTIPIEGTHHRGRIARIEHVQVGDRLVLEADWQNPWFDPVAIEVFDRKGGTLGYLTRDAGGEDLLLGTGFRGLATLLPYVKASVASVTPLSQRRSNAKYALLDVLLELDPKVLDPTTGQVSSQVLDKAKAILRRPKDKRNVTSIMPSGTVEQPVLSTLAEAENDATKSVAGVPGTIAVPDRIVSVQPAAATRATRSHTSDDPHPEGIGFLRQRLVDVLSYGAERRLADSVAPEKWTFAEGNRATASDFSIAIPDGWRVTDARSKDNVFRAYPAGAWLGRAVGDQAIDCILYCPSDASISTSTKRELGKLGIPELVRARTVQTWTSAANQESMSFEDAKVVHGHNCDVLVLRDTSLGHELPGVFEGFSYRIIPCMALSHAYVRLCFPRQRASYLAATLGRVCRMAESVEVSSAFECDLLTYLGMCRQMKVDADFFIDTCVGMHVALEKVIESESAACSGHPWKYSGGLAEARLGACTRMFHYVSELYDGYTLQESYGAPEDELSRMLLAIAKLMQGFWFLNPEENEDWGDFNQLRTLTLEDSEALREADGLEDLCLLIDREHPGFRDSFSPQATLAIRRAEKEYDTAVVHLLAVTYRVALLKVDEARSQRSEMRVQLNRTGEQLDALGLFDIGQRRKLTSQTHRQEDELSQQEAKIKSLEEEAERKKVKVLQMVPDALERERDMQHDTLAEAEAEASQLEERVANCRAAVVDGIIRVFRNRKFGDSVSFGRYPQGAHGEVKPIEWMVLEAQGTEFFLLSTRVLDWQPLKVSERLDTFEHSDLAQWLKDTFAKQAFSDIDRMMLEGTPTLLTTSQLRMYLPSEDSRRSKVTDYAVSCGADPNAQFKSFAGCTEYWTGGREKDTYDFTWDEILVSGSVYDIASVYESLGVRPAIRVKLRL